MSKNIGHIHLDLLPQASHHRAAPILRAVLNSQTDPEERLRTLLMLSSVGAKDLATEMKDALSKLPDQLNDHHQHLVRNSLEILGSSDKDWMSVWVARRIASGTLLGRTLGRFRRFHSRRNEATIARSYRRRRYSAGETRRSSPVLAVVADRGMVQRLFVGTTPFGKRCSTHRTSDMSLPMPFNGKSYRCCGNFSPT